jgi:hypothetical protein
LNIARRCPLATLNVQMLDEFVSVNRSEIISRCRAKVVARSDQAPNARGIDRGVPMFLDQLLDELRNGPSADLEITATATQHGRDLLEQGYTVSEVVHGYGDVCQAITELAVERRAAIGADDFKTLNRCLDDAIAGAVTEYARERGSGEPTGPQAAARNDLVARDLLKAIQISKVAYEAIRSGHAAASGSTGGVLGMGLDTALGLAERLLLNGN